MLKVELHTNQISDIFTRFRDAIGEHHWLKREVLIKNDIRGNPFLKDYLLEENSIVFSLAQYSTLMARYKCIPVNETKNRSLYPAISFAAQTLSIMENCSVQEAKKLIRRIHGALKNPEDIRAIQFEMLVATHFVQRGYSIIWPEMQGIGTFDLLIEGIGNNGLEVECKSISRDKGRKIHRREAIEFHQLIKQQLQSAIRNLRSGLSVVLTVPSRLPTSYKQRKELARNVLNQVLSAQDTTFSDGSYVHISEFDIAILGNLGTIESSSISRPTIDQITSTKNREVMLLGNKNGVIIFVVQSQQDDLLLEYIFDTVSKSAKNQMSKSRPASFLVGFHDIDAEALLNLANQDSNPSEQPTALRVAVSHFLANQDRDHVVGMGFLSRSALEPGVQGEINSGGTAYYFPRKESAFWHQDFSGLFS